MATPTMKTVWYKVLEDKEELAEGRVMSVSAGHHQVCLAHFEGKFCALDNRCPHQGGPLGEGSFVPWIIDVLTRVGHWEKGA